MRTKYTAVIMILLSVLLISGCMKSIQSQDSSGNGLFIGAVSYGLGGDLDQTLVTYTIKIVNQMKKPADIQTVTPVLRNDLRDRLVRDDISVPVNKTIDAGSSLEVTGSFYLNTQGLDKQGIEKLNIELDEFKVIVEQVIGRSD